ncbi:hypothetical protein HDU76_009742, partial [Blyttiomyces sp. JEL0837]
KLEVDLQGRAELTKKHLHVAVVETKTSKVSYGRSVRQVVARAKVYKWVGLALALRKAPGYPKVSDPEKFPVTMTGRLVLLDSDGFQKGGLIEEMEGVMISHETSRR